MNQNIFFSRNEKFTLIIFKKVDQNYGPISFGSSYSVKNVIKNFQDFIKYILYFFVQESKKSQSPLKLRFMYHMR